MTDIEMESAWLASLSTEAKIRFLARLGFEITIAGRGSYEAGTEDLVDPRLLRRINETLHRVTSFLLHVLRGSCWPDFDTSVATLVLATENEELRSWLAYCWHEAKAHDDVNERG